MIKAFSQNEKAQILLVLCIYATSLSSLSVNVNKEIPQTVNRECQKVVSFANVVGISPTILAVKNSELIFFLGAKLGEKMFFETERILQRCYHCLC